MNDIICGDNVSILKCFPDNYFDLTVTSSPYDNLRTYNGYKWDFKLLAKELYRVTKIGGIVVWVVGDGYKNGSESLTSFKHAIYFVEECKFRLHDTMIYEKSGFAFPSLNRYHQIFEYMFIFSKGKPKTFNPICDEKKRWKGSWGKRTERRTDGKLLERNYKDNGLEFKMRTNIWRIINSGGFGQTDKLAYKHPATFPEKLAEDHIISWSNENEIILDPFCGSGTTLKMAKKNNRKYIGIDISEEYCRLSKQIIDSI